ncbi:16S rRNA (guanine966-N2)-methyltransferase [Pseudorhodobacter antarcticus]|jgi:16S rRNA (guanine966-N2)-methyltransferase|uniref:16S rRNA (Guanine966-N2)-methyltransferase n=1 Tax=Pseudorhodobacter antarcticus TaxID=1077947 RepID=A0A1H8AGT1_9RHOB|nr:16S rRNA (guanine(966)-N(2))-methyltransferase RsmD [Pseudorhodobacter antarcticus]SEM69985.1 16S rRNA (guanine966-N2)-methyltransferase [Pseudorhodobacter antarcticus]
MRIIGGTHRGTHLAELGKGDAAAHLRPTSDRVREAMFNLLINGRLDGGPNPVAGARVLDLFAGTGALALEAMSRGAAAATLVEDGKVALALIKRNLEITRMRAVVLRQSAVALPRNTAGPFDLIFMDPPYARQMGEAALASARAGGWIAPGAVVVWEENAAITAPPDFAPLDQRTYGDTTITILRTPV